MATDRCIWIQKVLIPKRRPFADVFMAAMIRKRVGGKVLADRNLNQLKQNTYAVWLR